MSCQVDDLDWVKGLPVGILFFVGTLYGFTRKRARRALALRDYPRLAERIGLERVGGSATTLGRFRGDYDGYRVAVDPEERAPRIVLFLHQPTDWDLRTYQRWKRVPEGLETLTFADRGLNAWLSTRLLSGDPSGLAEARLAAVESELLALRALTPNLREFSLAEDRLECVFDFGTPPFIPAALVADVLKQLAKLARAAAS